MKKHDLIDKKFERLTVLSTGRCIISKNNKKYTTWNCLCDCGKKALVKTVDLIRGSVKSCGCLRQDLKIKLKEGQKINNLTTIKYIGDSLWECRCICGNIKNINSYRLSIGKTKSCGCLKRQISRQTIKKAIDKRRKYSPDITSARRIWQNYCYMDKKTIKTALLNFQDFYQISQKNCYYCGNVPSNNFNLFKFYKNSENSIKNGNFIYNGLDRIDNNKLHTKDNCVSCCIICNRAKNNKSIQDFYKYIQNINIKSIKLNHSIISKEIPKEIYNLVKIVFNQNYNERGLFIEEFYSISQKDCFYCSDKPNNVIKRKNKIFKYNGIDRLDNSKGHIIDNIVPCCKYCNFAKSDLSIEEFENWIKRIKKHNEV